LGIPKSNCSYKNYNIAIPKLLSNTKLEQSGGLEPPWVSRQFTKLLLSPLSQPCFEIGADAGNRTLDCFLPRNGFATKLLLLWSIVCESNTGFRFTRATSSHWTNNAQKILCAFLADAAPTVFYSPYNTSETMDGFRNRQIILERLRRIELPLKPWQGLVLPIYESREIGACCENRIRFLCLEGRYLAIRSSTHKLVAEYGIRTHDVLSHPAYETGDLGL
jgi:hypothetical protein